MLTTYKECRDAIIDAYFKDEIKPFDSNFCFCGTLCPEDQRSKKGNKTWNKISLADYSKHFFSMDEYGRMERVMLLQLEARFDDKSWPESLQREGKRYFSWKIGEIGEISPVWEEYLFKGMSAALDEMRQIFIERGLPVDEEETLFVKRKLLAV